MIGIYKIENPKGKVYIGKSINIEKRHNQYKKGYCQDQPHLYNSLKKYGWENHKVDIIEECPKDELNKKEEYWILFFNSVEKGLNLTYGGEGNIPSEITRCKMSKAHKGMKKPWAGCNMKLSKEHQKKLIEGRKSTQNPIYQYDLGGNFIKQHQNVKQASDSLNINNGYLHTILDNTDLTLGGFRFTRIYYEKLDPIVKYKNKKKKVLQYDLNGNFIREWDSAKEIALFLKKPIQNITACCRNEVKTAYNFIFKYK